MGVDAMIFEQGPCLLNAIPVNLIRSYKLRVLGLGFKRWHGPNVRISLVVRGTNDRAQEAPRSGLRLGAWIVFRVCV